jgi:Aspartyl protease
MHLSASKQNGPFLSKRFLTFLLFSILLALSIPAPIRAAAEGGKMLQCSGLPCIELHFAGGKVLTMLIDTGNVNSVLEASKATQLGLSLSPVMGADGKAVPGYSVATLNSVHAGDAALGDIKVLVMDIKSDINKGTFPKADGTLAYTALKDKLLVLDYAQRSFTIAPASKEGLSCDKPCGVISNPTFGKDGPPILATTGFTLNGKPLVMQIDTLWSGTMLLYDEGPAKIGQQARNLSAPSLKFRSFPFTDGGVKMLELPSQSQGFQGTILNRNAPYYSPTPGVHQPDALFDGTVGNELFEDHVLRIDFASHRFSIK